MTGGGGAKIILGGHEKFIYVTLRGGTIYCSLDQTNKVKTTNSKILVIVFAIFHDFSRIFGEDQKKVFSPKISTNSIFRLKIHAIFHKFLCEDKKKKKVSSPKISTNSGLLSPS